MDIKEITKNVLIGGGVIFCAIIIYALIEISIEKEIEKKKEIKYIKLFKENEKIMTDFFHIIVKNKLL